MKVKNLIFLILLLWGLFFVLTSVLHVDRPEEEEMTQQPSYAAGAKDDFKTEIGKYGGTLYNSTIGEGPKTFNPWNAKDNTSSEMGSIMFDGLVTTDAYTGEVIPMLAEWFEVDDSGTVYTVRLRENIRWSDGRQITSDDVVFTWNTIIAEGYGNTSSRDNVMIDGKMPEVKKLDRLTVQFITPKPFAPFLRMLSQPIAPKHVFEPVVKKGKDAFNSFYGVTTPPEEFVTSGMFRLERYIPAQRVVFMRNPDYYKFDAAGQRLPYLKRLIYYVVGDINNQVLKFESGQLDLLTLSGSNVARFKELEKHSDYTVYNLGPDTGTLFLSFNLNRNKNPLKQEWFNDKNFRKAVFLAIDRDSIVMNILRGVGAPLYTAESLSSIFLNEKLKDGEPKNIEEAKELLAESGFSWDNKGNLLDKKGNIVEFTLLTNAGNTERESVGVMIKQDLEELGMKVNFKPMEFNVLVGKLSDSFDWEAVIIGLTGSPLEPHSGRNVWSSTGALHMFNQRKGEDLETRHDLRPWEAELDEIYEKGAITIDFEERKKYYDRYQEIVYEYNPFIYIYSGLRVYAIRNKFGNLNPTALGGPLHNLEEIYVRNDGAKPNL